MRKRLIRILLVFIVIVTSVTICLVSGVHVYLKTEHAQKLMLATLNEFINGELLWQDISVSLLKGEVGIGGAVLRDPDGRKLASFDDFSLDLSLMSLFQGRIVMEHVKVQSPWVYLGVDSNNTLILMQAFSPWDKSAEKETKGGKIPLNVVVNELIIVDGAVLYENKDRSFNADISGIELTTNADLFARSMDFTAQAAGMSLTGRKINADLQRLLARTSLRKDMLDPILIQAETGLSQISMKGSVKDLFTEPDFDLTADVALSLPEFKDALDLSDALTGEMVVRVGLKGTLDNPEVRMHMDYGGGIIAGLQVDSADLDAGFIDRILEVKDAHIISASGSVAANGCVDLQKVFPAGIFTGNRELDAVSYTFSINGEGIDLERLPVNNIALKGRLSTNISLSGTGISQSRMSFRVSADISCEKLVVNDNGPALDVFLKTRGGVEDSVARVDILEARSGQSTLEAKGSLDIPSQEIMARIEIDVPDLKGTLKPFGIDGNGRLAVAADISETFSHPLVKVSINGKQLWFEGITLGDIACTGGLDRQGNVKVSNLILENKGSRIQGSGSVKLFEKFPQIRTDLPLKFAAEINHANVKDFFNAPDIEGVLEGELSVSGSMDSPDARINLTATGAEFKNYHIGNVRSTMGLAKGMFSLDNMLVENNRSRLHISGEVKVVDPETRRLIKDPQIRINLDGTTVFLQDIAEGLTGRVTAAARLHGSMKHPQGSVSLTGDDMDLGFQKVDKIIVLSTIKNQRIMVDTLKLVPGMGNEPFIGTGWVSLQGEYAVQLSGSGFSLENIDVLAANHVSKGRARFSISGNGTFADPSLNGDIILSDVFVNQERLGDVGIIFDLHDNIVHVSGKQGMDFSASYIIGKGDFSASVLFDHTDLAPYFQIVHYQDLSGIVTGKILAGGNIHNIPDIKASMDVADLSVY
ncbi:MAG: hypothetical protein JXM72_04730, partial [Deltaproteobacteria bacterium]|nr:hypothetical protein [Deltaproteobacteria bacterium]